MTVASAGEPSPPPAALPEVTAELAVRAADFGLGRDDAVVEPTSREEGFRALYAAEFGHVAGYCVSLVGEVELARDLAQEAFARLFARWVTVREPKAYVFYVATNLARRHWRRSAKEREIYQRIGHSADAHSVSAHDPWLRELVLALPERLREPVLLHYFCDLPIAEVALLVRRPAGTIKRRLFEARALLAGAIGADPDGEVAR